MQLASGNVSIKLKIQKWENDIRDKIGFRRPSRQSDFEIVYKNPNYKNSLKSPVLFAKKPLCRVLEKFRTPRATISSKEKNSTLTSPILLFGWSQRGV